MEFSPHETLVLQKVRRLEELEKEFLKYTYETSKPVTNDEAITFISNAFHIAYEAFTAKNEIFDEIRDISELRIYDRNALMLLDKLRKGDSFSSISFYESTAKSINVDKSNGVEEIPTSIEDFLMEKFDDLFSDFHSWFDLIGYYVDKTIIGPLISSSKVPNHLLAYFNELKETYAFCQYRSSLALCRVLLEMALYDKLKARGEFNDKNSKVTHIDVAKEDNLNRYINIAKWKHLISSADHEIAHKIRTTANSVLHAKDKGMKLNAKEVLQAIFDTIRIIENLYR
jgi:hypothetical protein